MTVDFACSFVIASFGTEEFKMEKIKLDRINELAHKSKETGLTDEEKLEQAALRSEFLAEIKADLRASLEAIEIVD